MIQLRDYQLKTIRSLKEQMLQGKKRLVMCAPTGAG
jgi:superfamily II DNA or RNA helicase